MLWSHHRGSVQGSDSVSERAVETNASRLAFATSFASCSITSFFSCRYSQSALPSYNQFRHTLSAHSSLHPGEFALLPFSISLIASFLFSTYSITLLPLPSFLTLSLYSGTYNFFLFPPSSPGSPEMTFHNSISLSSLSFFSRVKSSDDSLRRSDSNTQPTKRDVKGTLAKLRGGLVRRVQNSAYESWCDSQMR